MRFHIDVEAYFGINPIQRVIVRSNNPEHFYHDFRETISAETNNHPLFVTCFVSGFKSQSERTDVFFMVGSKADLLDIFFLLSFTTQYEKEKPEDLPCVLRFLREAHVSNRAKYPLFMEFCVNTGEQKSIHLCNVAIAPHFQGKDLMRKMTLDILRQMKSYHPGISFTLSAIGIHEAVHLLFSPHDRQLKQYAQGDLHESNLDRLLQTHTQRDAAKQAKSTREQEIPQNDALRAFILYTQLHGLFSQMGTQKQPLLLTDKPAQPKHASHQTQEFSASQPVERARAAHCLS